MANAVPAGSDNRALEALLKTGRFTGLANTTKWNELIVEIRSWKDWRPSYRWRCINGYVSNWDVEWFYHLPYPFKYTLWFDIGCCQSLNRKIIDRSDDLVRLVQRIGLDYRHSNDLLRIFGYAPRDYEFLDD